MSKLTIVFSTKKIDHSFIAHLKEKTYNEVQILPYENNGEHSLTEIYNKGLIESDNDIVIFLHDDIMLDDGYDQIVLNSFEKSDYGILGVAGTNYMPESGVWWENRNLMVGQIYHGKENVRLTKYSEKQKSIREVAIIDGVFMAVNKSKIKAKFNEDIKKFHFYDISFCIDNFLANVKIGVVHLPQFIHKSLGQTNEEYEVLKKAFLDIYGEHLPLKKDIFNRDIKSLKYSGKKDKVSIIIPSKNNYDLLIKCVNSIHENCANNNYEIIVADTGSNDETIDNYKNLTSVNLVYFDYYNFAKINNEVVRKYVTNSKFLLFCNDDIEVKNDVIAGFLNTYYKRGNKTGTIGGLLYFPNNQIQHSGVLANVNNNRLVVGHKGYKTYHDSYDKETKVIANTGALMFIKKTTFKKMGGFEEKTVECFEDLLLNMKLIKYGHINIFNPDIVAIHHESVTRNKNIIKLKKEQQDFNNILIPYVQENYRFFKNFLNG